MNETLVEKLEAAGVVGAGGAGFPTAIKFKSEPEILIINSAECEPLLQVDQLLAQFHARELIDALAELTERCGAREGIFAIKEKHHEALAELRKHAMSRLKVSVFPLGNHYPAGDEHVLVYETTGRIVPEGNIPISVGVVVINTETLLNCGAALRDVPVTRKFITVAGEVKNPATVQVPLGVSIGDVIEMRGGATIKDYAIIDGGPMMGNITSPDALVTKTTKGIIVLDRSHPLVVSKSRDMRAMMNAAKTCCCHCMLCTEACPRYLLGHAMHPDKLMRLASYNSMCEREALATEAFLCCECAMCEVACVMNLQPWRLNIELKKKLKAAGVKNPHTKAPQKVHEFREWRRFPADRLIKRLGLSRYAQKNEGGIIIEPCDRTD